MLTGTIPQMLDFPSLLAFTVLFNELTGSLPLGLNEPLFLLSVSNNMLSGSIDSVAAIKSLELLIVDRNKFTGSISDLFCETNLSAFSLANNNLSGKIPDCVSALSSLTSLQLFSNYLTGSIPLLPPPFGSYFPEQQQPDRPPCFLGIVVLPCHYRPFFKSPIRNTADQLRR
jgi:hypothetical protein